MTGSQVYTSSQHTRAVNLAALPGWASVAGPVVATNLDPLLCLPPH